MKRWFEIRFFQPGDLGWNLEEPLDEALEEAGFSDIGGPAGASYNDDGSFDSESLGPGSSP